jgi:hypothetical protein
MNAMSDVVCVAVVAIVVRSLRACVLAGCARGNADRIKRVASGNGCHLWQPPKGRETRTGTTGFAEGARPQIVSGYLTVAMNARHALAGTLSALPLRFWVSRTITAAGMLATSTHSPPFAPE